MQGALLGASVQGALPACGDPPEGTRLGRLEAFWKASENISWRASDSHTHRHRVNIDNNWIGATGDFPWCVHLYDQVIMMSTWFEGS